MSLLSLLVYLGRNSSPKMKICSNFTHPQAIQGVYGLLVDYCDVLSAVGTLLLTAPIHCRGLTGEQVICSNEETKYSTAWMAWGWVHFQLFFLFELFLNLYMAVYLFGYKAHAWLWLIIILNCYTNTLQMFGTTEADLNQMYVTFFTISQIHIHIKMQAQLIQL